MEIRVYSMQAIGKSPFDKEGGITYKDIASANRKIEDFLIEDGFSHIGGCFLELRSKGVIEKMQQNFLKEYTFIETFFGVDRKNNFLSYLNCGIATKPGEINSLSSKIAQVAEIPLYLTSESRPFLIASLENFRNLYGSILVEQNNSRKTQMRN